MTSGTDLVASKSGTDVTAATIHPATSTPEVSELIAKLPAAPTKLGVTTECVKKTTFTETVVKRVTNNQAKPKIEVSYNILFVMLLSFYPSCLYILYLI